MSPAPRSSPLVHVSLPPGTFSLPAGPAPLLFGLVFQDNDRNLQINLPLNLTLFPGDFIFTLNKCVASRLAPTFLILPR